MSEKIIHRIDQIRKHYNLSYNAFDNLFGFSNGYIGVQIRKERNVGSDVIEKISCYFTDVNLKWFLTGKGRMFSEDKNLVNEPQPIYKEDAVIEKFVDEKIDEKFKALKQQHEKDIYDLNLQLKKIQEDFKKGQK
jgi:hypothetical protein